MLVDRDTHDEPSLITDVMPTHPSFLIDKCLLQHFLISVRHSLNSMKVLYPSHYAITSSQIYTSCTAFLIYFLKIRITFMVLISSCFCATFRCHVGTVCGDKLKVLHYIPCYMRFVKETPVVKVRRVMFALACPFNTTLLIGNIMKIWHNAKS